MHPRQCWENLRSFLGENFGVGYLAIGLGIFLLSIYIAFSRYGTIRLGKPDATDDEVVAAAKAACCHEFIVKLENGYDTNAGDAGGKLSGGERQRITIARAILKNARVIILDEATAYADPENEYLIQNAISKLVKGKTLIVVVIVLRPSRRLIKSLWWKMERLLAAAGRKSFYQNAHFIKDYGVIM